ncbi:MAG: hypothetical protein ABEH43_01645, partial [Flavobacteriales bacterium]
WGIDAIGGLFTKDSINLDSLNNFNLNVQVRNKKDSPLTNKKDSLWMRVSGVFEGNSEEFLYIGNFWDSTKVDTFNVDGGTGSAYYYIEDVVLVPAPEAKAGIDQTICHGDSVKIGANSKGDFYRWKGENILKDSTTEKTYVSPDSTSEYVLEVSDTNGCTVRDSVTVQVTGDTLPNAEAKRDTTICRGDSVQLRGIASGGDTFFWKND